MAAANSAYRIGPDDLQVLLVSADGGDYRPGDWLEPKDGGNQRMMIVSAGQMGVRCGLEPAAAVPLAH